MDAYYRNHAHLPIAERRKVNWDHPEAFDWELLVAQLAQLGGGRIDRQAGVRLRQPHAERRTVVVPPADVVVIDGILLFVDHACGSCAT